MLVTRTCLFLRLNSVLMIALTQNWSDNLSSSSRCDTYCTFKSRLNIEKYLSIDIHFYFRKYFARARCSGHKLKIELGRRNGLERKDRICSFCFLNVNLHIIEYEYHAFFICPKYVKKKEKDIYIIQVLQ